MTHLAQTPTSTTAAVNREMPVLSGNYVAHHNAGGRDMELMAAAQAGSAAAFDELHRLYSTRLFRTIHRMTRNREDAEDALQETFMHAYLAIHKFEGRSGVYCWLTRIAINTALMVIRRRRCRPESLCSFLSEEFDGIPPFEVKDTAYTPEQLCDLRQRSDHLVHAIQNLEPSLRGVIEIQLTGDHSLKEMAEIMNISVAAVKARLFRARARLTRRFSARSGASKYATRRLTRNLPAGVPSQERQCAIYQ